MYVLANEWRRLRPLEYDKPYKFYPYGLRIHLIEADRISTPHQTGNSVYLHATDPNTHNRIYNGVEVDDSGKIVAYHICSTYPNSTLRVEKKWTRVKPSEIRQDPRTCL